MRQDQGRRQKPAQRPAIRAAKGKRHRAHRLSAYVASKLSKVLPCCSPAPPRHIGRSSRSSACGSSQGSDKPLTRRSRRCQTIPAPASPVVLFALEMLSFEGYSGGPRGRRKYWRAAEKAHDIVSSVRLQSRQNQGSRRARSSTETARNVRWGHRREGSPPSGL